MKWLFLLFAFTACTKRQVTHIRQVSMTMPVHIQIGDRLSPLRQWRMEQTIRKTFKSLDATINHWNPNSEVSKLNRHPINTPFTLSPLLATLLLEAQTLSVLTDALFDPGLGTAIAALKERLYQKTPLKRVDPGHIANLKITKDACLKKEPLYLDLDGISKGYGVDHLLENLSNLGLKSLYVNWGGEIATRGHHPSGRPWQVAVGDEIIPLENCGIATSNNFYQYGENEGQKISHYVNRDGSPHLAKKKLTITVAANSCSIADSLATTFMMIETADERASFLEKVQKQCGICYYREDEEK